MNRKLGLLTASAALAVTLGGCAQDYPQPVAQVEYYYCSPGYYLASDYRCYSQAAPPPASYADTSPTDDDPPASQPAPPPPKVSAPTWEHDLKTAGAGAAIGAVAGNQLAKRGAAGAAAGEVGGAEAGAGAAAGEAGAGVAVGEGAVETGTDLLIERALIGIGEVAIELLPLGISSHQSWRALVRHPVYVVSTRPVS